MLGIVQKERRSECRPIMKYGGVRRIYNKEMPNKVDFSQVE